VSDAIVSQYDVLPTLLEHVGLDAPDDDTLPGASFEPVLCGERSEARENVVVYDEYGPVRMIRTREWKYVHRFPAGPHELYDLVNDPDERRNLVDEKDKRSVADEMLKRMAAWFERYVDPRRDGARFPVSGGGQFERIDDEHCGEEAFSPRDY
jgi:arylsulfatase A-like enzyme